MMPKFGKLRVPEREITVYGEAAFYNNGTSVMIESFVTGYPGVSDTRAGEVWASDDIEKISQAEFNAAFLNITADELDKEDATLSIGDLREKYPEEEA